MFPRPSPPTGTGPSAAALACLLARLPVTSIDPAMAAAALNTDMARSIRLLGELTDLGLLSETTPTSAGPRYRHRAVAPPNPSNSTRNSHDIDVQVDRALTWLAGAAHLATMTADPLSTGHQVTAKYRPDPALTLPCAEAARTWLRVSEEDLTTLLSCDQMARTMPRATWQLALAVGHLHQERHDLGEPGLDTATWFAAADLGLTAAKTQGNTRAQHRLRLARAAALRASGRAQHGLDEARSIPLEAAGPVEGLARYETARCLHALGSTAQALEEARCAARHLAADAGEIAAAPAMALQGILAEAIGEDLLAHTYLEQARQLLLHGGHRARAELARVDLARLEARLGPKLAARANVIDALSLAARAAARTVAA